MGNKGKYKALNTLVSRAMQGDKKSFVLLLEQEAPQIIYTCIKLMGNLHEGEDAAQEVFICIQKKLSTLQMPEMYTAWVQKIIYYVCGRMRRNNMKHAGTVPIEEFADLFSEENSEILPEEYVTQKEKSKELMALIDHLPDQIRAAMVMHYFNDMKIVDVAAAMGLTEGAVKSYLYLGREKIRKEIKPQGNTAAPLNAGALLPMSALGRVFNREMEELVTPQITRHCLKAAGIKPFSASRWLSLPQVKDIFLTAACTSLAAILLVGYALSASTQPALPSSLSDAPQHHSGAAASWNEDTATAQEAATPESVRPGPPPSGPGGTAPVSGASLAGSLPAAQPGGTEAQPPALSQGVPTQVKGALAVENAPALQNPAMLFANQYCVTLEQNGKQLAMAMVDDTGHFILDDLTIATSGTYTLQIHSLSSYGLAFSSANPTGTLQIYLQPGQTYLLETPFLLVDDAPPELTIRMLDGQNKKTAANPQSIEIEAYDATGASISWTIINGNTGAQAADGTATNIGGEVLAGLPGGRYTLRVQAADELGNTTLLEQTFYITES